MSTFIKVNGGDYIPVNATKRLRAITAAERESLRNLGAHVNPDKFNTRLDYADGTKSYAEESIDQIRAQNVALIEVEKGAYVPKDNILKARALTDKDRDNFQRRTGRPMRNDFSSRLETRAGPC